MHVRYTEERSNKSVSQRVFCLVNRSMVTGTGEVEIAMLEEK
jgi:hypothetical protein